MKYLSRHSTASWVPG